MQHAPPEWDLVCNQVAELPVCQMVQGQASLQGYLQPLAAVHSAAKKLEIC
jgi:hypothetical protein